MVNARKFSAATFFLGIIFFAFGIFLPVSFLIEVPPQQEACIAIFPTPPECLPTKINGFFAIGVTFFLIGGYYFGKAAGIKRKDFKI